MKPKPVRSSAICGFVYRVLSDLNTQGKMSGGRLSTLMDTIAAKAARRHRRGRWVTAHMAINFLQPIHEDEELVFCASLNWVWNTSCEIGVKVFVKRGKTDVHAASGYLYFVALNSKGKPTLIPQVISETQEELRRFQEAEERRAKRPGERQKPPS